MLLVLFLLAGVSSLSVQKADPAQCNLCIAGILEWKVMDQDEQVLDLLQIIKSFACENVPIENCDDWMTKEYELLHKTVKTLDPTEACSWMGLCASRIATPLESNAMGSSSDKCDFCHLMGEELNNKVFHNSGAKVDVDQLCVKTGLCAAATELKTTLTAAANPAIVGNQLCQACRDVLGELKKTASDPQVATIASDIPPVICELVHIPLCESIISEFVMTVFRATKGLDVSGTCERINAC